MKSTTIRSLLATLLLFLLAACPAKVGEGPTVPCGKVDQRIIGGTATTGDPNVVMLLMGFGSQASSLCSGTLIAKRVVITAAHCVDNNWGFIRVYFGSRQGQDPAVLGQRMGVAVKVHPAWNAYNLTNDIALVRLDSDAPTQPKALNTEPMGSKLLGQPVRLVGFGASNGTTKTGVGVKRQTLSKLDGIFSTKIRFNDGEHLTCNGDSGGPAFMTINGQEKLVGITSYGDSDCAVYSMDTRVDSFYAGFIAPTLAEWGQGLCQ
jgi:secreted trypsin-like serine protease